MRSPVVNVWLILCVMAQVVCCAVPPGATVCVRSMLAPMLSVPSRAAIAHDVLPADTDVCEACCCEGEEGMVDACSGSDEDRPLSEAPPRGPCRDRECSLCVKSFHAIPPARGLEARAGTGIELIPLTVAFIGTAGVMRADNRCAWQRPPPVAPIPQQCGLVGTVILQV